MLCRTRSSLQEGGDLGSWLTSVFIPYYSRKRLPIKYFLHYHEATHKLSHQAQQLLQSRKNHKVTGWGARQLQCWGKHCRNVQSLNAYDCPTCDEMIWIYMDRGHEYAHGYDPCLWMFEPHSCILVATCHDMAIMVIKHAHGYEPCPRKTKKGRWIRTLGTSSPQRMNLRVDSL